MRHSRYAAVLLLAWALCASFAHAAPFQRPAQRAEIKLAYGINDVKIGAMALRIVRAHVGTLTASSADTYTVFLLPTEAGEPWMHVLAPAAREAGYSWRDHETADANTRATAFYRQADRLYVVQATKIGATADANGSRKTVFDFKVFIFNGSDEVPMFKDEASMRSTGRYVDAREALQEEFFRR